MTGPFRCDRWAWEHNWQEDYCGVKCADCGDFYPYGCEPWAPGDLDEPEEMDGDWHDGDVEDDELEDALGNCHAFLDGDRYVCGAVGSEDCDECPFNGDLGKIPEECL